MKTLPFSLILLLWIQTPTIGQLKIPELSPAGLVRQNVGFTTITVNYERPAARGRVEKEIFGELIPFGKVWRTGAGMCTRISFSTDVFIEGKRIKKGTYSLYTIPERKEWTIILNSDTVSYGTSSYDEKKDVVRLGAVSTRSNRFYESFTIDVDVVPNDAKIYLSWLNTQVSFSVNTGADQEIEKFINANLISKESDDPDLYEAAISYYLWHKKDRKQVLAFIERGIQLKNHRVWYYWKVSELTKAKRFGEARAAAKTAIALIQISPEEPGYLKSELVRDFENMIEEIDAKAK